MRIQNNITAMNTHRMYTINNDNVAKSAEKLSSGYRINRAGDDAAGLAISEKMRSQIRGLNMATKNSQDAISLVQTAEGALQETHSMLQRMNELAVQAATGTNENLDRTALAKEFEQLKREINDVAEQTNFNNMKILDGSLSYEGYVRSAATAGVNATVTAEATVSDPGVTSTTKAATHTATGTQAKLSNIDISGLVDDKQADYKLEVYIDGKKMQLKDGANNNKEVDGSSSTDADSAGTAWADLRFTTDDGRTFKINGGTADKLEITEVDSAGAAVQSDLNWSDLKLEIKISEKAPGESDYKEVGSVTMDDVAAKATDIINGVTAGTSTAAETKIDLDPSKIKDGDSITIGDKTYVFYKTTGTDDNNVKLGKDADGNEVKEGAAGGKYVNVMWNGETAGSDLADNLANAISGTAGTAFAGLGVSAGPAQAITATASGNSVTVQATVKAATVTAAPTTGGGLNSAKAEEMKKNAADATDYITPEFKTDSTTQSTKTTVEFDIAKMKDGDTFHLEIGGKKVSVEFSSKDDRQGFMDKVEKAIEAAGLDDVAKVKGNALLVENRDVKIELDEKWKDEKYAQDTNAIRIQVGANEHEMLSISIDSMNTKGLGLDDAALTKIGNSTSQDQDLAGKAITAVKKAIDKVSDQRATLGAMQNRLDHKIANLKVSSENLSAAESRIRDVDMASEMTNFTKNNILSQAATAMLAQANALPQNVLSLLG